MLESHTRMHSSLNMGPARGGRWVVALALALGACGVVWAAPPVEGLIVKLKDAPTHERMGALGASARSAEAARLQRVLQHARLTEARTRPAGASAQHLHFGRGLSLDEAQQLAERLRSLPEVAWVEPNTREQLLQAVPVPNDLYFDYVSPGDTGQWWLRGPTETLGTSIPSYGVPDIQLAWAREVGSATAVVAVLDTGITSHPDLNARVLPGYDFVSSSTLYGALYANDGNGRDDDPMDPGDWVSMQDVANNPDAFAGCQIQASSWHGTLISGMVAATTNNGVGVAAINWNGRVLPVRVAGKCGATVTDIVDGMRWAAGLPVAGAPLNANPARVLNISFGGDFACGSLYQETINELAIHGVVVVAAAGNGQGTVTRPANCSGVVGVAALARDGLKAGYSNFGTQVTIATVGGDPDVDDGLLTVLNTGAEGPGTATYGNVYGTSFAAPIASGVVGLMLSANPGLTVQQVINGLRASARPHVQSNTLPFCSSVNNGACVCTTTTCGAGILDADGAVRYAASPPPVLVPGGGGGGGGGALGGVWLAGLALAVAVLGARRLRGVDRA